jgi:NAD(P)-dependent dehydrogenase (short-subunit alcohol dehydrogenase family)
MRALDGAAVLVTGGASGIGRASAVMLAHNGARVMIADRNLAGATEACATIVAAGGTAQPIEVDVADPNSVDAMVDATVAAFGSLDVLVHCAAILKIVPIVDTTNEDWRRVLSVNLDGTFYADRAAARVMVKQGSGRIINITSGRGAGGAPRNAAYASAKGGVNALTFSLAQELKSLGIRVNAVDPGATETPLMRSVPNELHSHSAQNPGAVGKPEDVAETVLFLASNTAGISGQIYSVRLRS